MRLSSTFTVIVVIFITTVSAPLPARPTRRRYVVNDVIGDVISGPEAVAGDVTTQGARRLLQMVVKSQLCDRRLIPPWRQLDDETAATLKVGSVRNK